MSLVSVNRDPSPRQLRQFGFVWLGFLGFFGGVAWFKLASPTAAVVLWLLAVVVPVAGWLAPSFMRVVFVGLSYAAWPIGFVVSHVVLAFVYYLVVTPIGVVMRAVGYDPMQRRRASGAASFWLLRSADRRGSGRYFRQF